MIARHILSKSNSALYVDRPRGRLHYQSLHLDTTAFQVSSGTEMNSLPIQGRSLHQPAMYYSLVVAALDIRSTLDQPPITPLAPPGIISERINLIRLNFDVESVHVGGVAVEFAVVDEE